MLWGPVAKRSKQALGLRRHLKEKINEYQKILGLSSSTVNLLRKFKMLTSSRRGNVELCKNLRVEQRQDDDLLQALDVVGRAADALERGLEVDLHRRDVGAAGSNLLPVPEDGLGHVLLVQVHRPHL